MILTQTFPYPGDIPVFYRMAVCYLNIEKQQLSMKFGKISLTARRNSDDTKACDFLCFRDMLTLFIVDT